MINNVLRKVTGDVARVADAARAAAPSRPIPYRKRPSAASRRPTATQTSGGDKK